MFVHIPSSDFSFSPKVLQLTFQMRQEIRSSRVDPYIICFDWDIVAFGIEYYLLQMFDCIFDSLNGLVVKRVLY